MYQEIVEKLHICVVIPTYNNEKTLANVINDVLQYTTSVIVVNDGSTDKTTEILKDFVDNVELVSYIKNRGKGYALKCGFNRAEELGYRNVITMDSDGQHYACDLKNFIDEAEKNPDSLLLGQRTIEGVMPTKNSFANKLSNFWFTVQTAYKLNDTQNGFRLYPLVAMKGIRPVSSRYEAELEMLIRSVWRGIKIIPVTTRVYYAPGDERVTHFRPGWDTFRISILNTFFVLLAIIYGYPSMFYHKLFSPKKKL